jgi:hypothetical protein
LVRKREALIENAYHFTRARDRIKVDSACRPLRRTS